MLSIIKSILIAVFPRKRMLSNFSNKQMIYFLSLFFSLVSLINKIDGFGNSFMLTIPIVTFFHLKISYHSIPKFQENALSCTYFDTHHKAASIRFSSPGLAAVFSSNCCLLLQIPPSSQHSPFCPVCDSLSSYRRINHLTFAA